MKPTLATVACPLAYALTPVDAYRPTLGTGYQAKVDPIIDRQLAEGGLRLAAMPNAVLGK